MKYRLKKEVKEDICKWFREDKAYNLDGEYDREIWERHDFILDALEPVEDRVKLVALIYLTGSNSIKLKFEGKFCQTERTFKEIDAFFNGELFNKEDMINFGMQIYETTSYAGQDGNDLCVMKELDQFIKETK